jgi:hypothetical protein
MLSRAYIIETEIVSSSFIFNQPAAVFQIFNFSYFLPLSNLELC